MRGLPPPRQVSETEFRTGEANQSHRVRLQGGPPIRSRAKTVDPAALFRDAVAKIMETPRGREASMYGPLLAIFTGAFGYAARDMDIDTAGEGGRPDVTVRATTGLTLPNGRPHLIDWIVVEAKDERVFADAERREAIFAVKSKYITPNTAWFVMVDPSVIVARPAQRAVDPGVGDIVVRWSADLTADTLSAAMPLLRAQIAGVPDRLRRFREGDESTIAVDRLEVPDGADERARNLVSVTRRSFYATVRETTELLQAACRSAFAVLEPRIESFKREASTFAEQFGGFTFSSNPLVVRGNPVGPHATIEHNREAARLRRLFGRDLTAASLAFEGLPSFQARTGAEDTQLRELFTTESANLVLARILLLRFLEDHAFFGPHRYMCNGGVEAFQKMKAYFDVGYTRLLEDAFRTASRLYAAAFNRTELDWIEQNDDQLLSGAIEWAMFQFSRYDFRTVRGDTLTGIYDRFLDRRKRKALGEFYTPPSVARYIVGATGVGPHSAVFDPACGSGTFLLEAFERMVGSAVQRGFAEWPDVSDALTRISGNDINSFSSVLAQIQLIWQVLLFRDDLVAHGFPELAISSSNALIRSGLDSPPNAFTTLDQPIHDAVVGNPPYIRPERQRVLLDPFTRDYFEASSGGGGGVSADSDTYSLFLYKALDAWCCPSDGNRRAGRVGFVIPLALLDANENQRIRELFRLGGRWTILEIVDLELVYESVFDADTIPMIFIAEARPATEQDTVRIRLADSTAVRVVEGAIRPEFDFDSMPCHDVPYPQLFTHDGRIPTRVTPRRRRILEKMRFDREIADAAKPFWVRRGRRGINAWRADEPEGLEAAYWTPRRMLLGGIAFRGNRQQSASGVDVYKGENIVATEIYGAPAEPGVDPALADDASIWRFAEDPADPAARPNLIPNRAFAVAAVAHCPNLCAFNPREVAFTNTAQIFVPRDEYADFPFDLLFLSNVYVYWYALRARMGLLRTQRSHIYPTNFALLPWSDALASIGRDIESLRDVLVGSSRAVFAAQRERAVALDALSLPTVKGRARADLSMDLTFSASFDVQDYAVEASPGDPRYQSSEWMLPVSRSFFDFVSSNDERLIRGIHRALALLDGTPIGRKDILNLAVPYSEEEVRAWEQVVARFDEATSRKELDAAIATLDAVVGAAFGLDEQDLRDMRNDMATDPFLSHVRPRYPGMAVRLQGFRGGALADASRYD